MNPEQPLQPPPVTAAMVAQGIPINLVASAIIGLFAGWAAGKIIPCQKPHRGKL